MAPKSSIYDPSIFAAPPSFMGVPFSYDLSKSKAAILGVPFDCGTHPARIGSRLGPNAIREQSALVRPYEPPLLDFNPIERLGLVDCGNARVIPGNVDVSYPVIEEAVWRIVSSGAAPVTMGGDGAVTLPQLRAVHRKYPDLVVLHIDAHTDTYPGEGRDRYNTATTFTRASEEGLLDTRASFHVGARGPVYMPEVFEHTRQHGYRLIPGVDVAARGIPSVLEEIRATLAGKPVYLCFDMDFFDPVLRARRLHPGLGRRLGARGAGVAAGPRGLADRRVRYQHGEPAA